MLRAGETAREQRRVIIGQQIHNNDAMRQIIMSIHNSSNLNELKLKQSEMIYGNKRNVN